jgi:hypothetical protein
MVFKCLVCHDFFRSKEGLVKHFVSKCENVFFTGLTSEELYPYLIDSSLKIKYDKNIIYTLQRNYQFDNVKEFSIFVNVLHMTIEYKKNNKKIDELLKNDEKKKYCLFCHKTFSTTSNLFKHIHKNTCSKKEESTEFDKKKWDMISHKIDNMKRVIMDLGEKCTIDDVFKDKRIEILKQTDEYDSEELNIFSFLKRNPLFSFEVKDSSDYEENNIFINPKVYMYYNKNLKKTSNSFDECFEMRHIHTDFLYLMQKDSILLFIEEYLKFSKNINVYVESIVGMKVIIHYRNIIINGQEVKKDVLFRPKNVLYIFKNWIQSIYFLIMDIIRHYVFGSDKYDHKCRAELYKLFRRHLQYQYADIMDNKNNFRMYVKKILKLFYNKNDICKENFFREVSNNKIYTGEMIIFNKLFDEIFQTEDKKHIEEKDRDLELLQRYDIESSDLISSKDILKMGESILDTIESDEGSEDNEEDELTIMNDEED